MSIRCIPKLYNDYGNKHDEVRNEIGDYLQGHEEDFSIFLVLDEDEDDEDAADFESYVKGMREDGEWGGNLELVAAARLYRYVGELRFSVTGHSLTNSFIHP
jgi:hypothetical protein